MLVQSGAILDLNHLTGLLHGPVPGELSLGLRPGLLRAVPTGKPIGGFYVTRDLRRHTETNIAPAHFRQADGAFAAVALVSQIRFAVAYFVNGPAEVAIPLERVHRE